jgi:PAS domain-containing protein
MEPEVERAGADPLLPQAAVCDRHLDRPATHLVEAPDGRGDSFLCLECFQAYVAGRGLPVLRHSPTIRQRRALEPNQRRRRRRAPEGPAFLARLFEFADVSVVLINEAGRILAAVGPPGGVLGYPRRAGILDHIYPDDLSLAYTKLDGLLERRDLDSKFRIRAVHADGSVRTLDIHCFNRLDDPVLHGIVVRTREADREAARATTPAG